MNVHNKKKAKIIVYNFLIFSALPEFDEGFPDGGMAQ